MKKILLSSIFVLAGILFSKAQTIFWIENFNNGCSQLCTTYSGPNGAWTFTSNGPASDCGAATTPNLWYVSCAENGNAAGACGTGCGNNATLHVGNDPASPSAGIFCPTGDCGAAYDAGGYCNLLATPPSTITDIQASSPVINCTGRSTITLSFNYLERGQTTLDNATVLYSANGGGAWSLLADMAKTATTCAGGQGKWTKYNVALPATADNNTNVKIAFRWVNNDDGTGTDPSFAVDSVRLTVVAACAVPNTGFVESKTVGCDSLCTVFTDTTSGATSRLWSFPGGTPSSSTALAPSVCYYGEGNYTVSLTCYNGCGNKTMTKNNIITVYDTPVPDFTTLDTEICKHDCINYLSSVIGNVTNYWWTFDGGNPNASTDVNPTGICYDTAGIYSTTLLVMNVTCQNVFTRQNYIHVNEPTAPVVSVFGDSLVSTAATTYQWYNSAGPISNATSPYYIALASGYYHVCISDNFGCGNCSDSVFASGLGIVSIANNSGISIYPNPVSGFVMIKTSGDVHDVVADICDVTGRKIKSSALRFNVNEEKIQVNDLSPGYYSIQIYNRDKKLIATIPFIKK
jgi:PKD repeat protein